MAAKLVENKIVKLRSLTKMPIVPAYVFMPDLRPSEPTLMIIDIEGTYYDVLSSIDWEKANPRVIFLAECPGSSIFPTLVGYG